MKKSCELCGKPGEMDFNAWLPSFDLMVRGIICHGCFERARHDMALAADLLKKRAGLRGVVLPVENRETLEKLARAEGKNA